MGHVLYLHRGGLLTTPTAQTLEAQAADTGSEAEESVSVEASALDESEVEA